ncbi:MAG: hypothetical protein IPJ88_05060 [Myxococcales bacterium]|nr:MAG: hypothetical protein IPJ88_05060 [Myxococcales bacterium]
MTSSMGQATYYPIVQVLLGLFLGACNSGNVGGNDPNGSDGGVNNSDGGDLLSDGGVIGDGGNTLPPVSIDGCEPVDLSNRVPASENEVVLPAGCYGPTCSSIGFTPLIDLGVDTYRDLQGGLYCGGSNLRPPEHEQAGLAIAEQIQPLNSQGNADSGGKVVLISIGMSNTTGMSQQFISAFDAQRDGLGVRSEMVVVDGAQGGNATQEWTDSGDAPWSVLLDRLDNSGVTAEQVQVAWIKLARKNPDLSCRPVVGSNAHCFPADAKQLADDIRIVIDKAMGYFPNLKMAYLTSRVYAGWATGPLNPEPYAYQSAFAVKHLIVAQMTGDTSLNYDPERGAVNAPWLAWGPYLWADGTTPRSDGLTWPKDYFISDGTHPSAAGYERNGQALLDFFAEDSTAQAWFLE